MIEYLIWIFVFFFSAKDFKSRAANLIRRRTTEATLSEKSLIPSREDVQLWEQSFDALLRHRCKNRINEFFFLKRKLTIKNFI